jgi:uncharacterized protein (TIGR01777 family)
MKVFMTGATGVIGSAVAQALVDRGDRVVVLSRAMRAGPDGMEFVGGRAPEPGPWTERIAGCDAAIHVAGEPIARWRWDAAHERRVVRSRIDGTRELVAAIAALPEAARPRTLLVASSVDVYPFDDDDTRHGEDTPAGDHLLAVLWRGVEAEAAVARAHGLRVVALRAGLVLTRGEHPYTQLITPMKLVFRGPLGTGEHWLSWVHIDDVAAAYLAVLDGTEAGAVNLVAPGAIRQADFAHIVAAVLKRELWSPIAVAALRQRLGPFADYLVRGRRAVPLALETRGFRFRRPDAAAALAASLAGQPGLAEAT